MTGRRLPFDVRLWAKVNVRDPLDCWPWMGSTNEFGYGSVRGANGKTVKAHRAAWSYVNGAVLEPTDHICHRCDNPPCCNPAHLYKGTPATNIRDMMQRGRAASTEARRLQSLIHSPRGDQHWTRRLRDHPYLRRGATQ